MTDAEIKALNSSYPLPTSGGTGGTGGTGTGTGTGTSGNIRDTIFQSMALAGGVSPYLQDFLKIPTIGQRDAVNGAIGTAADPLFMQYSGACDDAIPGVTTPGAPGTPGTPGGGGTGGYLDWLKMFMQMINKMIAGFTNKLNFNITNQISETGFWKVTNNALLQNMQRY
jgi:hypothetical protein